MAKKTVPATPREQPEQVARRIEDLVGVQPGQGRGPGQKSVINRMAELEREIQDRDERIEQLFELVEDLGDKYSREIEKLQNVDRRLINEGEEFSNLSNRIERLERKLDDLQSDFDREDKDFFKVEEEVGSIKNISLQVNRQFIEYQQWVSMELEALEGRVTGVELEILPDE